MNDQPPDKNNDAHTVPPPEPPDTAINLCACGQTKPKDWDYCIQCTYGL